MTSSASRAPWVRGLVWICVLVSAAMFVTSGAAKVIATQEFSRAIERLGGGNSAPLLALYLPWLEICTGAMLLVRGWRQSATALMMALLMGFTGVLAVAWLRGETGDCGCMGMIATSIPMAVLRNVVLMGTTGVVLWGSTRGASTNE